MAEAATTGEELFTSTSDEELSPTVSTTEDQLEELDLSEENDETSNAKAEEARQAQLDGVFKKIKVGDKSIDDLNSRQAWMKPYLEARLQAETLKERKAEELDIEAILDEKLKARESKRRFQELRDSLQSSDLTANQKAEISEAYKELRKEGLGEYKALDTARKLAGVKEPSPKANLAVPRANTVSTYEEDINDANFRDKFGPDDPRRIEYLEKKANPSISKARRFQAKRVG